jgi:hypothetical protein
MMDYYVNWLRQHPVVNLLLVCGYVLFVVFAHEWFVNLSVKVMNSLTLETYNQLVAAIAATAVVAILVFVVWAVRKKVRVAYSGIVFLLLVLSALVMHFFVLTEMNIEFIHAMEFGVLALLIFPLVGRYGAAAIYALPVMVLDEWYQYQVLFDYVEYFDFNDILLDLLGAGLFLSILKAFRRESAHGLTVFKRHEFYSLLVFIAITTLMLASSMVVPYAADYAENTLLILNDIQEPYGFWREHPLIGSTYHVLEPISGVITTFSVCLIYLAMDPTSSEK